MTTRTVKLLGWGTGQAEITAVLDGERVFSGKVDLEELTDNNGTVDTAPTLFTFEIPMEFAGTKHMVISVDKSAVRFGQIVANYTEITMGEIIYGSGPDIYADVSEMNFEGIQDPRGNEVTIDGEKQTVNRLIGRGTWHWPVNPGSTFEHSITIDKPGLED
jgi:hypothetical protein